MTLHRPKQRKKMSACSNFCGIQSINGMSNPVETNIGNRSDSNTKA